MTSSSNIPIDPRLAEELGKLQERNTQFERTWAMNQTERAMAIMYVSVSIRLIEANIGEILRWSGRHSGDGFIANQHRIFAPLQQSLRLLNDTLCLEGEAEKYRSAAIKRIKAIERMIVAFGTELELATIVREADNSI